jgi:hypothetical protein
MGVWKYVPASAAFRFRSMTCASNSAIRLSFSLTDSRPAATGQYVPQLEQRIVGMGLLATESGGGVGDEVGIIVVAMTVILSKYQDGHPIKGWWLLEPNYAAIDDRGRGILINGEW